MGLQERLKLATRIGLDTPIFIYHMEANPVYLPITKLIFSSIAHGKQQAITSVISLMEINVHPFRQGREDVARKYETLLINYPNLKICDITREIVRQAARLRANYRLHSADALQVASCMVNGAQVFITNDRQITCLNQLIDVLILDDLLSLDWIDR